MKYHTPDDQSDILPNLLGLTTPEAIAASEFEGVLKAGLILSEELSAKTRFNVSYILKIHKMAFSHLYAFAGKYRDVNLSKGGFPFAAARFLTSTMQSFEVDILAGLPDRYDSKDRLITDIAKVHGELLFIHPFREGNGRTARILANLMCRKQGYKPLQFEKIGEKEFAFYVSAVQQSAQKNYEPMEKIIRLIFSD